jgi:hypothetical protein
MIHQCENELNEEDSIYFQNKLKRYESRMANRRKGRNFYEPPFDYTKQKDFKSLNGFIPNAKVTHIYQQKKKKSRKRGERQLPIKKHNVVVATHYSRYSGNNLLTTPSP